MKSKKSQTSVEFMLVFGVVFVFFIAFFFFFHERTIEAAEETDRRILEDFAGIIEGEIKTAIQTENGYERVFEIPNDLLGNDFSINLFDSVDSDTEVKKLTEFSVQYIPEIINEVGYEVFEILSPNVTGMIGQGKNVITKRNNFVYVYSEKSCSVADIQNDQGIDLCLTYDLLNPNFMELCCRHYEECCPEPSLFTDTNGGIVAYYKFDSNANDYSGNNNNGENHGAEFVEGVVGQALMFDGVSDYVKVPYSPDFDIGENGFTYEAWIKPSELKSGIMHILGQEVPYFGVEDNGRLSHGLLADGTSMHRCTNILEIEPGQWYHVVAIYDLDVGMRLYINGIDRTFSTNGPFNVIEYSNNDMFIGRALASYLRNTFSGLIDEVKIYNHALTQEQILENFESINT